MIESRRCIVGLIAFLLIVAGFGCTPKRTYQVLVINDSDGPVTAWMHKVGRPVEPEWVSPAEYAFVYDPSLQEQVGLPTAVLQPGQRATFGPRRGIFPRDATAVVRLFQGDMPLETMVSLERRSVRSSTVALQPGENVVRITSADPVRAQRVRLPGGEGN